MKFHQLRTFIAVMEQGSISAAARQLDFTPSTVSAHIKALEDEYGIQLFERSHAGVAPTQSGRALAPYARRTLDAASGFANEAASRRGRITGQLRLACSVAEASFSLSRTVARLGEIYPELRLNLSRGESAQIIAQVRDQEADLGIVYGRVDAADLSARKLGQAQLLVALPAAWLASGSDPLAVISRRPWIQTGDDCPFQALSRRFFDARKIDPPSLMRVDDNRTRREFIISGMGVSLLDRHEADHPAIAVFPGEALACETTLVVQAHRQFEPVISAARDVILQAV